VPACPPAVAAWPLDVPVFAGAEGLCPPCEPACVPDGDEVAGEPPVLEEDELEDEVLLPDGEDVGDDVPLADPDEPELLLGGALGIGMLVGLGCVMTLCDRQPDNSNMPQSDAAVATRPAWSVPGRVRP
jgi:hypothetical protein